MNIPIVFYQVIIQLISKHGNRIDLTTGTGDLIMGKTLLFLENLYPGINSEVIELISLVDPFVLRNSFPGNLCRYPGISNGLFPGNLLRLLFIFHTLSI